MPAKKMDEARQGVDALASTHVWNDWRKLQLLALAALIPLDVLQRAFHHPVDLQASELPSASRAVTSRCK